jgi:AcrR family transcriptional regulator
MMRSLDQELAALWSALPLEQRTAAATLSTLADATGIEPGLLQRHWRDALLVEVTDLARDEILREFEAAELERKTPTEAITASVRILASIAARYPQVLEHTLLSTRPVSNTILSRHFAARSPAPKPRASFATTYRSNSSLPPSAAYSQEHCARPSAPAPISTLPRPQSPGSS